FLSVPAGASDPVGIYALIDRVVFEPDATHPAAIQIWGVFALSDGRRGDNYRSAERGYLYYTIDRSNEAACRAEWSDLRAVAGTGHPIGFGARYSSTGRVRRPSEAPAKPDRYPLGVGLVRMLDRHLGPQVHQELRRAAGRGGSDRR
ncbi:MAG: hypothetical protein HYZ58_11860, partial [Acidobacteria bacterium]|nr:hypothetical protein [Acidobacteriota bacterium]